MCNKRRFERWSKGQAPLCFIVETRHNKQFHKHGPQTTNMAHKHLATGLDVAVTITSPPFVTSHRCCGGGARSVALLTALLDNKMLPGIRLGNPWRVLVVVIHVPAPALPRWFARPSRLGGGISCRGAPSSGRPRTCRRTSSASPSCNPGRINGELLKLLSLIHI